MRITSLLAAPLLALAFTFTACGDAADTPAATSDVPTVEAHGEGDAYTAAYVCPMHCEGSGSDQVGECPVCGMTYVARAEHTEDGHRH